MTALAADTPISTKIRPDVLSYPVADNVLIYKGALVSLHSGYLVPAADTAGDVFVGIADQHADNTVVGHAAGGISCMVQRDRVALLTTSGMAQSNVGATVYVLDSGTVALTGGVTNHVAVGTIENFVSATQVWVSMNSALAVA